MQSHFVHITRLLPKLEEFVSKIAKNLRESSGLHIELKNSYGPIYFVAEESNYTISLSESYLEYLWLVDYVVVKLCDKKIISDALSQLSSREVQQVFEDIPRCPLSVRQLYDSLMDENLINKCSQILYWAETLRESGLKASNLTEVNKLPQDAFYIDRIDSMWLCGVEYIILHEFAHMFFDEKNLFNTEEDADDCANAWYLSSIGPSDDKQLTKTKLFAVDGIFCSLLLVLRGNGTDDEHASSIDRIKAIYKCADGLLREKDYQFLIMFLRIWSIAMKAKNFPKEEEDLRLSFSKMCDFIEKYSTKTKLKK